MQDCLKEGWQTIRVTITVALAAAVSQSRTIVIDPTCLEAHCHPTIVFISEAAIQPMLLATGVLTNSASLVIIQGANIAEIFKICLMALTLSDLCADVTGFTQLMVEVNAYGGDMPFGRWERPAVASYSLYFTYMLFMCTSAGLVILIVVLRSFIVSRPVTARRVLTKKVTRLLCWGVFIVTALLFSPTILNISWQSCYCDYGPGDTAFCVKLFRDIPNLKRLSNTYLYMLTAIYGPLLVLVYVLCYIGIRVSLSKTSKTTCGQPMLTEENIHRGPTAAKQEKKKAVPQTEKITSTLLVILILDTFCTVPQVVQGIGLVVAPTATIFDKGNCWYTVFDVVVETILCLRPVYNFWLYVYSHKGFRDRCRHLLGRVRSFCCRCASPGVVKLDRKPLESLTSIETRA